MSPKINPAHEGYYGADVLMSWQQQARHINCSQREPLENFPEWFNTINKDHQGTWQ